MSTRPRPQWSASRRAAGARRFRHRLLKVALLAALSVRQAQDRPQFRALDRERCGRRRHRARDRQPRPWPRNEGHRRRRRATSNCSCVRPACTPGRATASGVRQHCRNFGSPSGTGRFSAPRNSCSTGQLIPVTRKDNPVPPVVASARFYDIADVLIFPTRKDIRWLPQKSRW